MKNAIKTSENDIKINKKLNLSTNVNTIQNKNY